MSLSVPPKLPNGVRTPLRNTTSRSLPCVFTSRNSACEVAGRAGARPNPNYRPRGGGQQASPASREERLLEDQAEQHDSRNEQTYHQRRARTHARRLAVAPGPVRIAYARHLLRIGLLEPDLHRRARIGVDPVLAGEIGNDGHAAA